MVRVSSGAPVNGRLKSEPEDFVVEEIPDAEPSGNGEHLYIWVEKRNLPVHQLMQRLTRGLNLDAREIGSAGLKDARAVTRQWLSLPARVESRLAAIEDDALKVLKVSRDTTRLRTGHLQGNRFVIRVRGVAEADVARARSLVEGLRATGIPNYFGPQRFGRDGNTLAMGRKLIAGEMLKLNAMLSRLALSSVQSALFNACLAARVVDGLYARVLRGDVIADRKLGIVSVAIDAAVEEERARAGRVVTMGPMFGPKMREARHDVAVREAAVLTSAGLDRAAFARKRELPGTRRPYRLWLDDFGFDTADDGFVVRFELPAGGYATVVLNEIITEVAEADEVEDDGPAQSPS